MGTSNTMQELPMKEIQPTAARPGSGLALLVIAAAQLMLVLDDSIANIALPSIQHHYGVPASTLVWVVNAYVLAFGSLLLFGGRLGDLVGRLRAFRAGLALFTLASVGAGAAWDPHTLIGARALQGLGAALVAPNALALITTNFAAGAARNKAMAVYGAMSALGITAGVALGGAITDWLGWRWVFFINVPIGLAVLAGSRALVEGERGSGSLGAASAILGTAAMALLAFGVTQAGEHGWTDGSTLAWLMSGATLTVIFLWMQARSRNPMLPLALLTERNRAGSYLGMLLFGAGMMGTYYLLTLFMQQVMHYSPLRSGLSSLPFALGIVVGAGVSSKLVERLAPRLVAGPGLAVGAAGMFWLSSLAPGSSYFAHIMPAAFLVSFGLGASAIATTLTAVHGVTQQRASVASAVVNMAQQLGAAFGIALMTAVATAGAEAHRGASSVGALATGYANAFAVGSGLLLLAAAVVALAVNTRETHGREAGAAI
jgi:EmrB/QacA subfamily drug resistance transporter